MDDAERKQRRDPIVLCHMKLNLLFQVVIKQKEIHAIRDKPEASDVRTRLTFSFRLGELSFLIIGQLLLRCSNCFFPFRGRILMLAPGTYFSSERTSICGLQILSQMSLTTVIRAR